LGGLGTTSDVHLRLIGKREVDFLFLLIEIIRDINADGLGSLILEFSLS